jgi:hypothetical protein
MEKEIEKKVDSTQAVRDPSRRQLLKILAAGGVVAGASMLPSKWKSPALKTNILPAHAQTTPRLFTIVANDQNWSVDIVGEETDIRFEAAAYNNGDPLENADLKAELVVGILSLVNVEPTGADGVADFFFKVNTRNIVGSPESPVATITFADQVTYGDASDTIEFYKDPYLPPNRAN